MEHRMTTGDGDDNGFSVFFLCFTVVQLRKLKYWLILRYGK